MQAVILTPKSLVISAAKINQALQNLLCNLMRFAGFDPISGQLCPHT